MISQVRLWFTSAGSLMFYPLSICCFKKKKMILSLFVFLLLTILACHNDLSDMRKQRKMGHITIVGPSMGIIETRLKSMLNEEGIDSRSSGQFPYYELVFTKSCGLNSMMLMN